MSSSASVVPSILILGTILVLSATLTWTRESPRSDITTRPRFLLVAGSTVIVQALHFSEELAFDFAIRFPRLFGLQPLDRATFVWFNVTWLAIWLLTIPFARRGSRLAFFPLWFLSLGEILNFVAHPLLALVAGGYFPGLVTAPLTGLAGALLLRQLVLATRDNVSE